MSRFASLSLTPTSHPHLQKPHPTTLLRALQQITHPSQDFEITELVNAHTHTDARVRREAYRILILCLQKGQRKKGAGMWVSAECEKRGEGKKILLNDDDEKWKQYLSNAYTSILKDIQSRFDFSILQNVPKLQEEEENEVRKQRLISNAFLMLIELDQNVSKEVLANHRADLQAIYDKAFWAHFESEVPACRIAALLYIPYFDQETLIKEEARMKRIFERSWKLHGGHRELWPALMTVESYIPGLWTNKLFDEIIRFVAKGCEGIFKLSFAYLPEVLARMQSTMKPVHVIQLINALWKSTHSTYFSVKSDGRPFINCLTTCLSIMHSTYPAEILQEYKHILTTYMLSQEDELRARWIKRAETGLLAETIVQKSIKKEKSLTWEDFEAIILDCMTGEKASQIVIPLATIYKQDRNALPIGKVLSQFFGLCISNSDNDMSPLVQMVQLTAKTPSDEQCAHLTSENFVRRVGERSDYLDLLIELLTLWKDSELGGKLWNNLVSQTLLHSAEQRDLVMAKLIPAISRIKPSFALSSTELDAYAASNDTPPEIVSMILKSSVAMISSNVTQSHLTDAGNSLKRFLDAYISKNSTITSEELRSIIATITLLKERENFDGNWLSVVILGQAHPHLANTSSDTASLIEELRTLCGRIWSDYNGNKIAESELKDIIHELFDSLMNVQNPISPDEFISIFSALSSYKDGCLESVKALLCRRFAQPNDEWRSLVDPHVSPSPLLMLNRLCVLPTTAQDLKEVLYDIYGLSAFGRYSIVLTNLLSKGVLEDAMLQERSRLSLQLVRDHIFLGINQIWSPDLMRKENTHFFNNLLDQQMKHEYLPVSQCTMSTTLDAIDKGTNGTIPQSPFTSLFSSPPAWTLHLIPSAVKYTEDMLQQPDEDHAKVIDWSLAKLNDYTNASLVLMQSLNTVLDDQKQQRTLQENMALNLSRAKTAFEQENALAGLVACTTSPGTHSTKASCLSIRTIQDTINILSRLREGDISHYAHALVYQFYASHVAALPRNTIMTLLTTLAEEFELGKELIDEAEISLRLYNALKLLETLYNPTRMNLETKLELSAYQLKQKTGELWNQLLMIFTGHPTITLLPFEIQVRDKIAEALAYCPASAILGVIDVEQCAHLLLSKSLATQQLTYRILQTTIEETTKEHALADLAEATSLIPPPLLKIASSIELEEDASWQKHLGALLAWGLILRHLEDTPSRLKAFYQNEIIGYARSSHILDHIISLVSIDTENASDPWLEIPTTYNVETIPSKGQESDLQSFAAYLYFTTCQRMPAFVRQWHIHHRSKLMTAVIADNTKRISDKLLEVEIENINKASDSVFAPMVVKTNLTTREVKSTYAVDESEIEMTMHIPAMYPLRPITVEGGKRVGVTEIQWRGWLISAGAVLASVSGSMLDALLLWKQNAEKRFDGVEDCSICYSVIGIVDQSLPNKRCKTCQQKFHAGCLYKWFKSSNQSSCPLCRNLF